MPKKLFLIFLLALLSIPLLYSLNAPITNGHYFRQSQTAQTAFIFKAEGWEPFLPKIRFMGRPGYNVLEFPWYQSLVAGASTVLDVRIETAGRLWNLIFGILLAWGVTLVLFELKKVGESSSVANEGDRTTEVRLWALLIFSSPLLFAMSQWVMVDVMNVACSTWAFYFFLRALKSEGPLFELTAVFLLSTISLTLKPTALFAISPLFLFILWAQRTSLSKFMRVSVPVILSFILTAGWFVYGDYINKKYQAGFGLSAATNQYFIPSLNLVGILKVAGRVLFYVIGCGSLFLLSLAVLLDFNGFRRACTQHRKLLVICSASILTYVVCFSNLNIHHSYYQLALVLPAFGVVFFLLKWFRFIYKPWVLFIALALNVASSFHFLIVSDQDLGNLLRTFESSIVSGPQQNDLLVITNVNALAPLVSYYRDRFVSYAAFSDANGSLRTAKDRNFDALGVCDLSLGDNCRSFVSKAATNCDKKAGLVGRFWICEMNHSL